MISYEKFHADCEVIAEKSSSFPGFEWTMHSYERGSKTFLCHKVFDHCVCKEFHVCYDEIYQVPTLFFNMRDADGKVLNQNAIVDHMSVGEARRFASNPWNMLTQSEHPAFRNPWFSLHPCKTESFLNATAAPNGNVVLAWLGVVASAMNLKIPLPLLIQLNSG